MSEFERHITGGGRGLRITRRGAAVAELAFGLPGERMPGWEPDEEEARLTTDGPFVARLRHLGEPEGWISVVSLDNTEVTEQALPPVGVAVTVAPGWAGWSWTSDTEGFMLLSPSVGSGPCLLGSVRRGFLRAAHQRPVFTPADRRGDSLGAGVAAFHLVHPTGSLKAHGRLQTTIEFAEVDAVADAAQHLPSWLPDLVLAPYDHLILDTPDLAIVPGPDLAVAHDDTSTVLQGAPGHREIAVHQVSGVQRLRATFAPDVGPFLGELVTALKSRRPSALPSATAAIIALALSRRVVADPATVLDWLEREDWLARGDVLAPAIAAIIATETHDVALLEAAGEAALASGPVRGAGLVATRCWLATLRLGVPPLDLMRLFSVLEGSDDPLVQLEVAVLRNRHRAGAEPIASGWVNRLGGPLPGEPMGLSEADAGLAVALLRMVPEGWDITTDAAVAAEKAASLLLADHADGLHPAHDGLAWLLLGEVGA